MPYNHQLARDLLRSRRKAAKVAELRDPDGAALYAIKERTSNVDEWRNIVRFPEIHEKFFRDG